MSQKTTILLMNLTIMISGGYRMLTRKQTDRVAKIDSFFIPHVNIEHAIKTIEQSILISVSSKEPQNVVLYGGAGTGKTTTCNTIINKRKSKVVIKRGKEVTLVPAFYCLTPSPVTIKTLASTMLKALGDPAPTQGIAMELTNRLGKLLKECETEVILLDELQHLLTKRGEVASLEVQDWLKTIINEFKVPIIAVGTDDCSDVINSSHQLARRFTRQCKLANLVFGVDKNGEYRKFINALTNIFIKKIKFESFPDFRIRDNALAVYIATGGNPADTTKLFKSAALNALSNKRESVKLKDFEYELDSLVLPNFRIDLASDASDASDNPFRFSQDKFDDAYSKIK